MHPSNVACAVNAAQGTAPRIHDNAAKDKGVRKLPSARDVWGHRSSSGAGNKVDIPKTAAECRPLKELQVSGHEPAASSGASVLVAHNGKMACGPNQSNNQEDGVHHASKRSRGAKQGTDISSPCKAKLAPSSSILDHQKTELYGCSPRLPESMATLFVQKTEVCFIPQCFGRLFCPGNGARGT